jgi:xanthine/CO dehydrogenase XdhC/CoxF family maturation factor
MIGSSRKARIIREGFIKKKIATAQELAALACPVGLPIGAVSVHEIAVSILAQYVAKRAQYFAEKSIAASGPAEPVPRAL